MTRATTEVHELEIIEQLQSYGEEYGIVLEAGEKAEEYAHRILREMTQMIGELTDAQKNVLALIA